jgi:protein tyrosine phosphatase
VAPDLHANFLYKQRSPDTLAGTSPYAIAMEYPRTETLETIFHLLAKTCDDVRISCMVIATDENRLQNEDLFPRYFDSQWLEKNRGAFPGIKVTSTAQATSPEGDYQLHRLQAYAENGEQLFALPLIRAVYWPDKGIIDRPLLENIIRLTTDFNAQANSAAGTGKAIPLFHCTAGLGRTGVLAAAFRIMDPEDPSSLGEILSGMIRDRSEYMVPTEEQFIFLVSLAKEYGKPVGIERLE